MPIIDKLNDKTASPAILMGTAKKVNEQLTKLIFKALKRENIKSTKVYG